VSRKVDASMRALSESNERSTGASVEIKESIVEMSAQAADVANTARALTEMAKGQQVLLSKFRLE
jgi:methyl-accepting chemotaxis protein